MFGKKDGNLLIILMLSAAVVSGFMVIMGSLGNSSYNRIAITDRMSFRFIAGGISDYLSTAAKNHWCLNETLITVPCPTGMPGDLPLEDWYKPNPYNFEKLLLVDKSIDSLKLSHPTTIRLDAVTPNCLNNALTCTNLDLVIPVANFINVTDHPIARFFFKNSSSLFEAIKIHVERLEDSAQYPSGGANSYLKFRVELKLKDTSKGLMKIIRSIYGKDPFSESIILFRPRELNGFAFISAGNFDLDASEVQINSTAWGMGQGEGGSGLSAKAIDRTEKSSHVGLHFYSPVLVEKDLKIPASDEKFAPVTFYDKVVFGRFSTSRYGSLKRDTKKFQPASIGSPSDWYWESASNLPFGGFRKGVEIESETDKGIAHLFDPLVARKKNSALDNFILYCIGKQKDYTDHVRTDGERLAARPLLVEDKEVVVQLGWAQGMATAQFNGLPLMTLPSGRKWDQKTFANSRFEAQPNVDPQIPSVDTNIFPAINATRSRLEIVDLSAGSTVKGASLKLTLSVFGGETSDYMSFKDPTTSARYMSTPTQPLLARLNNTIINVQDDSHFAIALTEAFAAELLGSPVGTAVPIDQRMLISLQFSLGTNTVGTPQSQPHLLNIAARLHNPNLRFDARTRINLSSITGFEVGHDGAGIWSPFFASKRGDGNRVLSSGTATVINFTHGGPATLTIPGSDLTGGWKGTAVTGSIRPPDTETNHAAESELCFDDTYSDDPTRFDTNFLPNIAYSWDFADPLPSPDCDPSLGACADTLEFADAKNGDPIIKSTIERCIIGADVDVIHGLLVCHHLVIRARAKPLTIVGTIIAGETRIDPSALKFGIHWYSYLHPQAAKILSAYDIPEKRNDVKLSSTATNVVSGCSVNKSRVFWAIPLAQLEESQICNVAGATELTDPFKWPTLDPTCGSPADRSKGELVLPSTFRCKYRSTRFDRSVLSRTERP